MARLALLALATVAAAARVQPAAGQTVVETLRQLRATARELGQGRRAADGSTSAGTAADGSAPRGDDGGAMIPPSVVVDDGPDSALGGRSSVAGRVETFDVRGLRLGMTPREVGRVADRQRFRRRWNDIFQTTGTFDLEAARIANLQLGRPIERSSKVQLKAVQGADPDGDVLKLEFTLEPFGARLSRIEYAAKLAGSTRQETFDALVSQYGRPSTDKRDIDVLSWSESRGPSDNSSPVLTAVVGLDGMTLTLVQSIDYVQTARKRLADRAQQLAASRGGGVRF